MKERDYAYEALAQVTSSDMEINRGELNGALGKIREMEPDMTSYVLADEIHRRAKIYPDVVGDVVLSAPALAKHWRRCGEVKKPERGTNRNSGNTDCGTCGGDRMVLVGTRPGKLEGDRFEEYAPCPDCNPIEVKAFRHDGSVFRTPDPGRVRELMNG